MTTIASNMTAFGNRNSFTDTMKFSSTINLFVEMMTISSTMNSFTDMMTIFGNVTPFATTTSSPPLTANPTDRCVVLGWNATIPWDNPHNLVSMETEEVVDRVKSAILIPLLFVIGAPANVINMAVFFKQGLGERINLCLFALALVDLLYLLLLFVFYAERIFTQFTGGEKHGVVYRYIVDNNVIGLYGLSYGTTLLSAIISTERCVCVLFPLRAQRCVPTKALAWGIVLGVGLLTFTRFAVTAQFYVACVYEERTGRTSWRVFHNAYHFQNREMLNRLDGIFYGFFVAVGGPVVVLLTTVITALKLQQTIRWRHGAASVLSSKEIGVTKMLICLSIEFFLLSIPVIVLRVVPVFYPQLTVAGHYNTSSVLLGCGELGSYTSSCVNFFVYYFTGSRYRETLNALFASKSSSLEKGSKAKLQVTSVAGNARPAFNQC